MYRVSRDKPISLKLLLLWMFKKNGNERSVIWYLLPLSRFEIYSRNLLKVVKTLPSTTIFKNNFGLLKTLAFIFTLNFFFLGKLSHSFIQNIHFPDEKCIFLAPFAVFLSPQRCVQEIREILLLIYAHQLEAFCVGIFSDLAILDVSTATIVPNIIAVNLDTIKLHGLFELKCRHYQQTCS